MVHLPEIIIRTIKHTDQQYDTVGNYRKQGNQILFEISNTKADYEFLVTIHELIEWYLVTKRGIALKKIDQFDIQFERTRKDGDNSEPGFDTHAPYHKEHVFADKIEELIAKELGVDWEKYGDRLNNLPKIES